MDRTYFTDALRAFIQRSSGDELAELGHIPTDLNLFDAGFLESFKLARLVAFLSHDLKLDVDLTQVSFESFYTIDQMYTSFARPASA
jgi:acyl carrier protein